MEKTYTVYVLQSEQNGSFYKGMTENIPARLKQHNAGKTKSTQSKRPWRVVYTEAFKTAEEARAREKYFKTAAGRRFLKKVLA
jgi:putative endonuclease